MLQLNYIHTDLNFTKNLSGSSGVTTGEAYETSAPPGCPPRWRCAQYIISVKVKAWSLYILYWLMNNIKFRANEQKKGHRLFWRIKVHDFRADEKKKVISYLGG